MRRDKLIIPAALLNLSAAVLFCISGAIAQAQQPDATKFNQTYETLFAKAQAECKALWANHAFDRFRDKIPLGEEKPTFSMLKNSERLNPKDRPIADLAMKTLERCRAAYAPVFALLPPQVNTLMQALQRKQDAIIAELYSGKITFGEYNIGADRMLGEFASTLSGIKQTSQTASSPATSVKQPTAVSEAVTLPRSRQAERNAIPEVTASHLVRLALVIGDSNYSSLPKLVNPANDARAIADLLRKMGFNTKLVLDASELDLRREVRKFANDTAKADIAFVFYAGHGAQVSGENYVLPVDIDIPRTDVDIQLTGLKIDDLVNSIRAKTKVIFLDACRDNPALFKNLVKGRGAYPTGLAPAVASNLNQVDPGGGVFIAYATDAGSVAQDGKGVHSPFTQALLRNLTKPISIDDMFSLVTREVRLVTKNTQRPYKYASLENIVCLTGSCSTAPIPADTDVFQQAKHSETEDLQIALQTKSIDALETYLQKYPESQKRNEVLDAISRLRYSEFNEWTLFEVGNFHFPIYIKISSVQQIGDRVAANIKSIWDPSQNQKFPDAAYTDELAVYDCKRQTMAYAERTIVSKSGQTLYHYKWADPQFLDLSIGATIAPGTVASSFQNMLCHEQSRTPLVGKKELATMHYPSVSSTVKGDGDVFYKPIQNSMNTANQKEVAVIFKMHEDTIFNLPPKISLPEPLYYRTEIDDVLLKCDENKFYSRWSNNFDAANNMVFTGGPDFSKEIAWSDFEGSSPYAVLQRIVCTPSEAHK